MRSNRYQNARTQIRGINGAIEVLEPRRLFSVFTVNGAGGGADYTDLETALVNAPAGSTLLVSPGTYTAHPTVADPTASVFWINKALTIVSVAGAGSTTLVAPAGQSQDLLISASNVHIEGFSLKGGQFCVCVQDFLNNTTLTNVVLKDLNLTPDANSGNGHGILFWQTSNSLINNCTVGLSFANGIFVDHQSTNDIVENSTVNGTLTQHGIAVKNSSNIQVLNNTVTSAFSDGVILLGSSNCTVVGNNLSGFLVDGITMTDFSNSNYVSLNTIVSNGLAAGRTDGTGIWMNNESDGNTVFANTMSGSPECGVAVFVSSNNLISGNEIFGNKEGGMFIWDAQNDPRFIGHAPDKTVIVNNYIHDNLTNGAINLRGATNTDIERNFFSGTFTGVYGSSTDGGLIMQRDAHTKFIGNTMMNLQIGVYIEASNSGVQVLRNREINVGNNYTLRGAAGVQFDAGKKLGGNYWSDNRGKAKKGFRPAYTKFIYNIRGKTGGGFRDAYPFADESLGLNYSIGITSPLAGSVVAGGAKQVIQWTSTASTRVDIYYSSAATGDVLIAGNHPDAGVLIWDVPNLPAASDYVIKIVPKDTTGVARGAAAISGQFTITAA